MDNFFDRYILHLQYYDSETQQPSQQMGGVRTHATFHRALLDLLRQPMDQYHPVTAKAFGFDLYIHGVQLMDMESGRVLASTIRMDPMETVIKEAVVFMEVAPGVFSQHLPVFLSQAQPSLKDDEAMLLPLYSLSPSHGYIYPTKEFGVLSKEVYQQTYLMPGALDPYQHYVAFTGFRNDEVIVSAPEFQYQAIWEKHCYDQPQLALAKMLLTPTAFFDEAATFRDNLLRFYFKAETASSVKAIPLAETSTIYPPEPTDDYPAIKAGRYLIAQHGWKAALATLGIPLPEGLRQAPEHEHIKIDYWSAAKSPVLRPTDDYEKLRAAVQERYGENLQLTYEAYVRIRPNTAIVEDLKDSDHKDLVADNMYYVHTQRLESALCQVLLLDHRKFFPFVTLLHGLDGTYLEAKVSDDQHRDLLTVKKSTPFTPIEKNGVYAIFHRDILAHPLLQHLQLSPILQKHDMGIREDPAYLYVQIMGHHARGLYYLPVYERISQQLKQYQLEQQSVLRPEVQKAISATVQQKDSHVLVIEWELIGRRDKSEPVTAVYYQGFSDPEPAMKALATLPTGQFLAAHQEKEKVPFRIKEATVWNNTANLALVSKYAEATTGQLTIELLTQHTSLREAFLYQTHLAGQAQGSARTWEASKADRPVLPPHERRIPPNDDTPHSLKP
jgi:hypothetical protein